MQTEKKIDINNDGIELDEVGLEEDDVLGELDIIDDLDDIERAEEDENMGHRLITADPEMDGDGDYLFNEKYFE